MEFRSHITWCAFHSRGDYTALVDTFADTEVGDLYRPGILGRTGLDKYVLTESVS
jgi:hypothetical protein